MTNLGYLVWFKIPQELYNDESVKNIELQLNDARPKHPAVEQFKSDVRNTIRALKERQVTHIRTGISWADWETRGGFFCINWYIEELAKAGFDILPCLAFTPPHLAIPDEHGIQRTSHPPENPFLFAVFTDDVLKRLGHHFAVIELWNEGNLEPDWNFKLDKDWRLFTLMIKMAALVCRAHKKKVLLGGISGIKVGIEPFRKWVKNGLMEYVDFVGLHGLRGTWSDRTPPASIGAQARLLRREAAKAADRNAACDFLTEIYRISVKDMHNEVSSILNIEAMEIEKSLRFPYTNGHKPNRMPRVWYTEIGFSAVDLRNKISWDTLELIQVAVFADALEHQISGKIERIYWYTLFDWKGQSLRQANTGWEDVLQWYFGDTYRPDFRNGKPKMLATLLKEGGPNRVLQFAKSMSFQLLLKSASIDRGEPRDNSETLRLLEAVEANA